VAWNRGVVDLLMHAQVEAALGKAKILTKVRMLRIDAVTRADRFSLDNSREIDDVRSLGEQAARQFEKDICARITTFALTHPKRGEARRARGSRGLEKLLGNVR
jgi:hypothetical protein